MCAWHMAFQLLFYYSRDLNLIRRKFSPLTFQAMHKLKKARLKIRAVWLEHCADFEGVPLTDLLGKRPLHSPLVMRLMI
jgi:hypothetical protein